MIVLLVALALSLAASHLLVARVLPSDRSGADRIAYAFIVLFTAWIGAVRLLGAAALLRPLPFALALGAMIAASFLATGRTARALVPRDLRHGVRALGRAFRGTHAALALTGLCALAMAVWCAAWLEPWAWDALGYHLPVVHDALQTGRLREVPTHIPYINAYPRAVDLFFTGFRLLLSDDRWIDSAQLPFGLAAIAAIGATAVRGGAPTARAIAYALAFAAIPVAALELATNYVDIAYAALFLLAAHVATGPLEPVDGVFGGLALGLFLASKPSAPLPTALVSMVVIVRAFRARRVAPAVLFVAIAFVLGIGAYVSNLLAHGNPLWPVRLRIGPLFLPGLEDAAYFFHATVPEPYRSAGWLHRLLASWFVPPARYIYDMRIGGLGPYFAFGLLPLTAVLVARRRADGVRLYAALTALAMLATPGAYWARYTLALPGALIALCAVGTSKLQVRSRAASDLALALLCVIGLWKAVPGFTDGGASLPSLATMTPRERAQSVGVDAEGARWFDARARVGEGEAFAYDSAFGLPGQLWRTDGRARVLYVPPAIADARALERAFTRARVRMAALGDDTPAGTVARNDPEHFVPRFHCPLDPCTVYEVKRTGE